MSSSKNNDVDWKKKKVNTYQQLNSKYDKALKDSQLEQNNNRHFENYIKRREHQIKKQQSNEKKTDFNVYNYDIEELAAILNFEYIPINKGIIKRRILELKSKFKNQEKYLIFFNNAEKRMIEHLENVNSETWTEVYEKETSEAGKVLTYRFQSQNEEEQSEAMKSKQGIKNQIINVEKNIIGQVRRPLDQTYAPKGIVQGKKNPFEIQEITRTVNFDSSFRQFLPPKSSTCVDDIVTSYAQNTAPDLNIFNDKFNQKRLYTPTNYIVNLSQPITNVISIVLDKVEIPNQWYTFSSAYGTDSFKFGMRGPLASLETFTIKIEEGNYSQEQLVTEINEQIWNKDVNGVYIFRGYYDVSKNLFDPSGNVDISTGYLPFPLLEFKYTKHDNKIKICNHFPFGNNNTIIDFEWYNTDTEENSCSAKRESTTPNPGGKVDYNLGWLMGFRGQKSTVYGYVYDVSGCRWGSNINSSSRPIYNTITTSTIPSTGEQKLETTSITTALYSNTIPGRSRTPPDGVKMGNEYNPLVGTNIVGDMEYYGYTCPASIVDIKGPRIFMLILDDYNNNKPTSDLISIIDTVDTRLKQPSYYNSQTMDFGLNTYYNNEYERVGSSGMECKDNADVLNNERGCSTNSLNLDLSSNLTKAQQYTQREIKFFNTVSLPNRFNSPDSPDLLALFPVNRNPLDNDSSIIYKNKDKKINERKYFGPVKLVKFGIKLLNDKGFEVDLNDADWSFSLIIKQLYQY